MASIVNLTPHAVSIVGEDGNVIATFEPAGVIARAAQTDVPVGQVEVADGITVPIVSTSYGSPTDLPDPADGVYLVVSILTAQAAKAVGRSTSDLLVTSAPVRDEAGRIIGARQFAVV